jgi:hypothetical protein
VKGVDAASKMGQVRAPVVAVVRAWRLLCGRRSSFRRFIRSLRCLSQWAARTGVKKFIFVSTAQVRAPDDAGRWRRSVLALAPIWHCLPLHCTHAVIVALALAMAAAGVQAQCKAVCREGGAGPVHTAGGLGGTCWRNAEVPTVPSLTSPLPAAQAEFMAKAEAAVQAVAGLPWIIVRPAVVYGPGDVSGLMPRCVVAAAYVKMGARMDFMWDGDLRCNTVHVFDVVRALYFLARKADAGTLWNLADKGDTSAWATEGGGGGGGVSPGPSPAAALARPCLLVSMHAQTRRASLRSWAASSAVRSGSWERSSPTWARWSWTRSSTQPTSSTSCVGGRGG